MIASRGFTIIELLVVLVLAGLLLGLAAPRFMAAVPGTELTAAARDLASAARQSRAEAISRGHDVVLVVDAQSGEFRAEGTSLRGKLHGDLSLTLDTASVEVVDTYRAGIRFHSDGSSTGGRVTLRNGERLAVVDVDWLTGRTSVERP